jgi:hypothetical protein
MGVMLPEMGQEVCKAMAIVISIFLQFNEICVVAQPNRGCLRPQVHLPHTYGREAVDITKYKRRENNFESSALLALPL